MPYWEGTPESIAILIAETFDRSGELLARFSDHQLNQAFWYLVGISSEHMVCLHDPAVPRHLQLRVLRSFVPLFEQVMAVRCSHHDKQDANPLNSACYMWWDILLLRGWPDLPERAEFDAEVIAVFGRLLAIPHDACWESALHGIGHWATFYPQLAKTVDDFLARTPNLSPKLTAYAESAKAGHVL